MGLEEPRKWLKKMTDVGAVQPPKSSCSPPTPFVPKSYCRGLRLCIDYRGINKITVSNYYPTPFASYGRHAETTTPHPTEAKNPSHSHTLVGWPAPSQATAKPWKPRRS